MNTLLLALVLAASGQPEGVAQPAETAPAPLYTATGRPGESMDALVVRASRKLSVMTRMLHAEVCGTIERDGQVWRLSVLAKGRSRHCEMQVDDGVAAIFHTHPEFLGYRFSPTDYVRPGYMIRGRQVCWQAGLGTEALVTQYGRRSGNVCAATDLMLAQ